MLFKKPQFKVLLGDNFFSDHAFHGRRVVTSPVEPRTSRITGKPALASLQKNSFRPFVIKCLWAMPSRRA